MSDDFNRAADTEQATQKQCHKCKKGVTKQHDRECVQKWTP